MYPVVSTANRSNVLIIINICGLLLCIISINIWKKKKLLNSEEPYNASLSQNIVRMAKSKMMSWTDMLHLILAEIRIAYRILVKKLGM